MFRWHPCSDVIGAWRIIWSSSDDRGTRVSFQLLTCIRRIDTVIVCIRRGKTKSIQAWIDVKSSWFVIFYAFCSYTRLNAVTMIIQTESMFLTVFLIMSATLNYHQTLMRPSSTKTWRMDPSALAVCWYSSDSSVVFHNVCVQVSWSVPVDGAERKMCCGLHDVSLSYLLAIHLRTIFNFHHKDDLSYYGQ